MFPKFRLLCFSFLLHVAVFQSVAFRYNISPKCYVNKHLILKKNSEISRFRSATRLHQFRAGALAYPIESQLREIPLLSTLLSKFQTDATFFFNALLLGLLSGTGIIKLYEAKCPQKQCRLTEPDMDCVSKPSQVKSLQFRFLIVFWLLRLSDWLRGPYFYEVFSAKSKDSVFSYDTISKLFLVGFTVSGLFGPFMGKFVDEVGRKAGTLLFVLVYSLSAVSLQSNYLPILILGRICSGLGTALLFSAPEAWIVSEFHELNSVDQKWLSQTFSWAYAGDSVVAILAGQLASVVANRSGPTSPFTASIGFLLVAAVLILNSWKENKIVHGEADTNNNSNVNTAPKKISLVFGALKEIQSNRKILLLGMIQALFEGAMYIFVLHWPVAIQQCISPTFPSISNAVVPYGIIFSCFMASCLLGSSLLALLQRKFSVEMMMRSILTLAAAALGTSFLSLKNSNLIMLIVSFFVFELCVGMYFPSIGILRAKYIPDNYRSVIMNLFGVPLNLIVVSVFLFTKKIGIHGSFLVSFLALAVSSLIMLAFNFLLK
jgi:MFS family permease